MKRLYIIITALIFNATALFAQVDSTTFTFRGGDSLAHRLLADYYPYYDTIRIDTSNAHLWQIGGTNKSFSPDDTLRDNGIMTDTLNPYPVNANDWFTVNIGILRGDMQVDIWHRYQTSHKNDGGIIEFSSDSGTSWMNIGDCPFSFPAIDPSTGLWGNVFSDSLATGEPAFTGNSAGLVHTYFTMKNCFALKSTSDCGGGFYSKVSLRFRFISDSLPDTLAGWEIDSIRFTSLECTGGVAQVNKYNILNVSPNPSPYGIFNFPVLDEEEKYTIEITNEMGQVILKCPYAERVDISRFTEGLYFYKVTNGNNYYTGKLLFD